jgi:hypothetical protein
MWVERRPKEGETVKVNFSEWTKLGTRIGVMERYHDGRAIIDFGDCKRYLDGYSTFFVFEK